MRLGFYGYALERRADGKQVLMDMRPFLTSFVNEAPAKLKLEFQHAGEYVFLTGGRDGAFTFLMTRDADIIKRINKGDLSVQDMEELLRENESVAFASFVRMEKSCLGYASTVMGPRVRAFAHFVNQLLSRAGIEDWRFVLHPFMEFTNKEAALRAEFIGKTVIQIGRHNPLFRQVMEVFSTRASEWDGVDSLEIVIKPADRGRRNIAEEIRPIIRNIPEDDLLKFTLRAREQLHDQTMDFYLAGQGHLGVEIARGDDAHVHAQIREAMRTNDKLRAKIREYEGDERFGRMEIEAIRRFDDGRAWADLVVDL